MMRATVVAALLLTGVAQAQTPVPPESRDAALELMATTKQRELMDGMLVQMRGALIANLQRSTGKPVADVTRVVDELMIPDMRGRLGELQDTFVEIYTSTYSLEDMKALVAFYATPLGQRLLQSLPQIAAKGMEAGQAWGGKVGRDVVMRHMDELRSMGFVK